MSDSNRREFIRRAGYGAAAIGAVAAAPTLLGSATASAAPAAAAPAPEAAPTDPGAPVIAVLKDAPSGEFLLMVGDKEVTFTDRGLAAKMTSALA